MQKLIKTCYFQIDGPVRQKSMAQGWSHAEGINTLLEYPEHVRRHSPNEVVELARVRFQAEMTFDHMTEKRIAMKDRFGLQWSVYGSYIDVLVPVMNKGVVQCWWEIVKRGSMYGLVPDVKSAIGPVDQDEDVPRMLNTVQDLRILVPYFEALAA